MLREEVKPRPSVNGQRTVLNFQRAEDGQQKTAGK
jgi:hypothetical protein